MERNQIESATFFFETLSSILVFCLPFYFTFFLQFNKWQQELHACQWSLPSSIKQSLLKNGKLLFLTVPLHWDATGAMLRVRFNQGNGKASRSFILIRVERGERAFILMLCGL